MDSSSQLQVIDGQIEQMLPAMRTPEDCVSYLGRLKQVMNSNHVLGMWVIGRFINHMRDTLKIEHPIEMLVQELGLLERTLRYCEAVGKVFGEPVIIGLAEKGMTWRVLRELASPAMAPHRDHFIQLFNDGECTADEIYIQVSGLKAGLESSKTPPAANDPLNEAVGVCKKLKQGAGRLIKQAEAGSGKLRTTILALRDELRESGDAARLNGLDSAVADLLTAAEDAAVAMADLEACASLITGDPDEIRTRVLARIQETME